MVRWAVPLRYEQSSETAVPVADRLRSEDEGSETTSLPKDAFDRCFDTVVRPRHWTSAFDHASSADISAGCLCNCSI
jgi:hypothetical protein